LPGYVVDVRGVGLVGRGATARVHDHPRVGELDHARVLLQHDLDAENLGVERRDRATLRTVMNTVTREPSLGAGGFSKSITASPGSRLVRSS